MYKPPMTKGAQAILSARRMPRTPEPMMPIGGPMPGVPQPPMPMGKAKPRDLRVRK
jgi:hypothetical protein